MTLKEFYVQLGSHDWYYQYSDDYGVYLRGQDNNERLARIAKESPEHQELYKKYSSYIHSKTTKPECPA